MIHLKLEEENYLALGAALGLYSDLPVIRLCYYLNNDLGLRLIRSPHNLKRQHQGQDYQFVNFEYEDQNRDLYWQLIENRSYEKPAPDAQYGFFPAVAERVKWLNIKEEYDYFLCFESEESLSQLEQDLLQGLKQLNYIKAAQVLSARARQQFFKRINQ